MAWRLRWFASSEEAFAVGLPVGAIWRTPPNHLTVETPVGLAGLDLHEVRGPDVTLTVSPSILTRGGSNGLTYHGYIRDGVLTDDVDGRMFPHHPSTA